MFGHDRSDTDVDVPKALGLKAAQQARNNPRTFDSVATDAANRVAGFAAAQAAAQGAAPFQRPTAPGMPAIKRPHDASQAPLPQQATGIGVNQLPADYNSGVSKAFGFTPPVTQSQTPASAQQSANQPADNGAKVAQTPLVGLAHNANNADNATAYSSQAPKYQASGFNTQPRTDGQYSDANTDTHLANDSQGINFAPQGFAPDGLAAKFDAQRPFVASFGDTKPELSSEQKAVLRAATTPHGNARGLTAAQLRTAEAVLSGADANAIKRDDIASRAEMADAANATALQREAMQSATALQRDRNAQANQAANEQARLSEQSRQFDAKLGFESRAAELGQRKTQLDIARAERLDSLQQQYATAKDDARRTEIAKQIRALSGNPTDGQGQALKPSDYTQKITRMVNDPTTGLPIQQDDIIDLRTGRSILGGDGGTQAAGFAPKGMRLVGTANGVPVYEDADGNRYTR